MPATATERPVAPPQKRDFRKEVTDQIVKMLEDGVAPWQKPWREAAGSLAMPTNPITEKAYRGGNAIHLMATGIERGYDDPRWMTYRQATAEGWQVRAGEKGTQIEFWEKKADQEKDAAVNRGKTEGQPLEGERTGPQSANQWIHRVYNVFNTKEMDGVLRVCASGRQVELAIAARPPFARSNSQMEQAAG